VGHRLVPRAQDRLASSRSVAQLAALARVDTLFRQQGIDYWLFGGWAVDFYAGAVTRPHDDVDIAVRLRDHDRIAALLRRDGWVHAPEPDEQGGTGYEREGVRLELTFIEQVPFPADAFGDDRRELDGVGAQLMTLSALERGKSTPRDDPDDAAKGRADAETLQKRRGRQGEPA
jgi:Aminoglycoside-2''-adenylyltransferase